MAGDSILINELTRCSRCDVSVEPSAIYCSRCGNLLGVNDPTLRPPDSPQARDGGSGTRRSLSPRHRTSLRPSRPPHGGGAMHAPFADPLVGATVADRYRILSVLGRGGMGVVYKVEHTKIGKIMAIKLLAGELARDRQTVQRFKREAMMASKLSHPNTVQVFDYGSAGGLTYLAMEYLDGQDLAAVIEDHGPQPFPQVAKMVIQSCGALKEAHDAGIVHRDIKPENLFLTRTVDGEDLVKVLDFGLAKLRESRELNKITTSGNIVGTPYYMPPEQVRGEDVDARGDVYALCALIYTCLTGTYVFDGPSPLVVLTHQMTSAPEPPHLRAPEQNIPESVSEIVLKGLRKAPDERFQSVSELADALTDELQGVGFSRISLRVAAVPARPDDGEAATRDEVERYERRLRRKEQVGRFVVAAFLLGTLYAGFRGYQKAQEPPVFDGRELEPNHEVESATKVPFGRSALGRLGARINPERGDQDNYRINVPDTPKKKHTLVHLHLTGLPNMRTCTWVFRGGNEKHFLRYCGGAESRGVDIPYLAMTPGPYVFVLTQDLHPHWEGETPHRIENVSDDYELRLSRSAPYEHDVEIEPNDKPEFAAKTTSVQPLLSLTGPTKRLRGRLDVIGDVDVVCAKGDGRARFVVTDAEGGARPIKAALRVTPLGGPNHKIPVRVHGGRGNIPVTERDQLSPWKSAATELEQTPCVMLEVVPNPFAPRPHPIVAPTSDHEWQVRLESAPPEEPDEVDEPHP